MRSSGINIILRQETPEDYYAVEELTRETFWEIFWGEEQQICDEHLLVHKLRKCPSFVPELDTVAELKGKIVGHVIYSKSYIENDDGKQHETLTFGPLSVSPEHQSKGIGRMLMEHTFAKAKEMGFRAVIIYGHPDYYPRVGFRRAAEFGITTPDGNVFDALMVYPLYDGALDGIKGNYHLDPVYESLTQEEAFEFDKRFPPKERHTPLLIDVLLERLEPEARKAIEAQNMSSLTLMKTRSEKDISSLPCIDAKAIETIRAVMQENNLGWGE